MTSRFKYSLFGYDPEKTVLASAREIDISHKHGREICTAIRGMLVHRAKTYLEEVLEMKRSVPFKRYKLKVGHRSDLVKADAGRYPVKAAKEILNLLNSLEKNAEHKGLQVDKLLLFHAATQKGRKIKRIFPRAFGRSSPKVGILTHVELAAEEV